MTQIELDDLKKALINSATLADVVFIFPSEHGAPSIHGHKAILSSNCIVFARMFTGDFVDEKELRIEDIKYDIFMQIIKYIYSGAFELTTSNMVDLLYAAQKYLLIDLKTKTEIFIVKNLEYSNFLDIINASQCFENPVIATKCCDIFCDNPLHFMSNPAYLGLSVNSMKILLRQPQMNCTEFQLKKFALEWLNDRNDLTEQEFTEDTYEKLKICTNVERWQLGPKALFNIETTVYQAMLETFSFKNNLIYFDNMLSSCRKKKIELIELYGIGIYIGIFAEKEDSQTVYDKPNYFQETINVKVWKINKERNNYDVEIDVDHKIKQKNSFGIEQIIFEKVQCLDKMAIVVDFGVKKMRSTTSIYYEVDAKFEISRTSMDENTSKDKSSCLAYILTNK
jgi:hypothetical protein